MTSHTNASSPDPPFDPVTESVAACSEYAEAYEAAHAMKMSRNVARFAGMLPSPSLIPGAGCGPGRDLARFTAHGHIARGVDLNPVFVATANAHAPAFLCDLRDVGDRFPAGM